MRSAAGSGNSQSMQPQIPKNTKGIFFDLYGTLLILGNMKKAWSDWMEVLYGTMCVSGLSMTAAAFDDCCHEFFRKEQPVPGDDGLTVFERRILRLANSLGL